MADKSNIEWTEATWNILTGCTVVSPGCTNCYAMKLAGTRLKHHHSRIGLTEIHKTGPVWNGNVRFNAIWLDQPLKWTRPRRIFVCAHGDLFHEAVLYENLDLIFAIMALAKHHTFQVLTKRPERALSYIRSLYNRSRIEYYMKEYATKKCPFTEPRWPIPNIWMGTSVEDQQRADERIPVLLKIPAAMHWISAEPLLGPIDLFEGCVDLECNTSIDLMGRFLAGPGGCSYDEQNHRMTHYKGRSWTLPKLDWVVVGGESGTGARPIQEDWALSLRDQCKESNTPFFFKQWGEYAPNWMNDDDGIRIPGSEWMDRQGKKIAGRILDGKTYSEYPV